MVTCRWNWSEAYHLSTINVTSICLTALEGQRCQ